MCTKQGFKTGGGGFGRGEGRDGGNAGERVRDEDDEKLANGMRRERLGGFAGSR